LPLVREEKAKPKMKNDTEYPFTAAQFNALNEEERQAVLAVAEYLTSSTTAITDEDLSTALNLMRETEGCVPQEEIDNDLVAPIRRKFAAVYQMAMELAEAELKQKEFKDRQHFNFCLVIEPSYEDTTHVAVVDYDKPICYLHEWSKAWHFQFADLAELAKAVLAAKTALVNKVTEVNAKEVLIVVEDGGVRNVVGLAPNIQVTIVDYDFEEEDRPYLKPSPIDGELCKLTRF
jgi:hypothetical protein